MLGVFLVLAGVAPVGCSRGDDSGVDEVVAQRSSQVASAARAAGLSPTVAEVVSRAARAPAATFSATYATGDSVETVVVHQRPPRRRVDVVDASGRTVSAYVVDDDGASAVRCTRAAAAWRCVDAGPGSAPSVGAFDPAALDTTIAALAAAASPVVVERATVAGVAAHCVRSGPTDRFCISSSGVPLLVERSDGAAPLRATSYRPSVGDDDLRRPDR